VRRLFGRSISLAILSALVAELALPAVVAARGPESRMTAPAVGVHGAHQGSQHQHHHPGCPWRGKGPCPHQRAADSARGPILTPCGETPAAAVDGPAPLLLDRGPVFDWTFRPTVARVPATRPAVGRPVHDASPETPPPRLFRAS
jgi:hypothetical protein